MVTMTPVMAVKMIEPSVQDLNASITRLNQASAILTAETESVIPLRLLSNVTMETT